MVSAATKSARGALGAATSSRTTWATLAIALPSIALGAILAYLLDPRRGRRRRRLARKRSRRYTRAVGRRVKRRVRGGGAETTAGPAQQPPEPDPED